MLGGSAPALREAHSILQCFVTSYMRLCLCIAAGSQVLGVLDCCVVFQALRNSFQVTICMATITVSLSYSLCYKIYHVALEKLLWWPRDSVFYMGTRCCCLHDSGELTQPHFLDCLLGTTSCYLSMQCYLCGSRPICEEGFGDEAGGSRNSRLGSSGS
jgi:hypothetical protein